MANANIQRISVPEEFLYGRVLAKNIVDADTGEVVAHANDEITESVLSALRAANVRDIQTLYTNDLDRGPYISQTLRTDETADQMAARVAIYRMMRPGEPPTEDRSEEHTSELQSLMRISYAVFCLKKKKQTQTTQRTT